jgi:hypothetical protein
LTCNRPDSGGARSSIRIRGWANSTTRRPGLHMSGRARTGGGQNPAATRRVPCQAPSGPPTPRPSTAMPHHAQPMANQGPLVRRAGALSARDASHAPVMHIALMKGDVHDRAHSHPPLCARRALPHQRPTNRRAGGGQRDTIHQGHQHDKHTLLRYHGNTSVLARPISTLYRTQVAARGHPSRGL